jgi:hypothetical protein
MRFDPPLTYRGALQILGADDPPWITRLGDVLGGAILAAPVVATLGPLAGVAALWGWVDQRNEAISLLRKAVARSRGRIFKTAGYERHQRVVAAHTAIVVGSFFEVLHEQYPLVRISEEEKEYFTTDGWRAVGQPLLEVLYQAEVPAPSAARGYVENRTEIGYWYDALADRVRRFLTGLQVWNSVSFNPKSLVEKALERYSTYYLGLSADVPEFFYWASFGEHAATRTTVYRLRADVRAALDEQTVALARLGRMLEITAGAAVTGTELRDSVHRANRGALTEPIIPAEAQHRDDHVTFPSVQDIYIEPRYRVATHAQDARPWDDAWWQGRPGYDDLDMFLAAYATAPQSTSAPLLLLGHPGAGKSMLTRVLAARLPASGYTVVRVPLRRVDADAPVYEQIQQELDRITHARVPWARLADESRETIRVVLLDGLDELLQASKGRRAGYLHQVADFQRREAEQGRPVLVIVTSRTVVADQVTIPAGSPVAYLDDFDEPRIRDWLSRWHTANLAGISSGRTRALAPETAMQHAGLVGQPLLLLVLAIYSADPRSRALDAGLSTAALYRELFQRFAYREATKLLSHDDPHLSTALDDHLWRLRVAALAMFNRGAQSVTDEDLGNDLRALRRGAGPGRAADLGQQTIGQFFFVHSAEADTHHRRRAQASYEFLHATFGEFLVADHLLSELERLASGGVHHDVSDDLLHALSSQQVLAKRRSILDYVTELAELLPAGRAAQIVALLDQLIAGARQRPPSVRFTEYTPMGVDRLREMATYTANLILLRVTTESPMPLPPRKEWSPLVDLWQSGLDIESWASLLQTIHRNGDVLSLEVPFRRSLVYAVAEAGLHGDTDQEQILQIGQSVFSGWFDSYSDRPIILMIAHLAGAAAGHDEADPYVIEMDFQDLNANPNELRWASTLLNDVLVRNCRSMDRLALDQRVGWFLRHRPLIVLRPFTLAVVVSTHPRLLVEHEELRDPSLYAADGVTPEILLAGELDASEPEERERLRVLRQEVRGAARRDGVPTPDGVLDVVRAMLAAQQRPPAEPDHP